MGLRTAEWLLALGSESGRVDIAFDFEADFALLQGALRCSGRWDRIEDASPVNIAVISMSVQGSYLAETCYRDLAARGLKRHHALADALALREAYLGVADTSVRMTRAVHSDAFRRLVRIVGGWFDPADLAGFDTEAWVHRWFLSPLIELGRQRPLDIVEEPDGPARLEECLRRLEFGGCA